MNKIAEAGPIRLALNIEDKVPADRLAALLAHVPGLQLVSAGESADVTVGLSDGSSVFATGLGVAAVWHLGETANTATGGYKDASAMGMDATAASLNQVNPASDTLAVIGAKIAPDKPREGAAASAKQLDGVDRWPVTISYFDPTKKVVGEQTPVYTMSFDLYADGISGNLSLDYGDFSLKGTMASLDFLPQTQCK